MLPASIHCLPQAFIRSTHALKDDEGALILLDRQKAELENRRIEDHGDLPYSRRSIGGLAMMVTRIATHIRPLSKRVKEAAPRPVTIAVISRGKERASPLVRTPMKPVRSRTGRST
jgi:hypothetical protein